MNDIKADEIKISSGHIQGYGGPAGHWVRVTYMNVLLDDGQFCSEREAGKAEARFESHWKRDWPKDEFFKAIEGKGQASPPCSHCEQDTQDGCTSQYDRAWCQRPACVVARELYAVEQRAKAAELEKQRLADDEARQAELARAHADAQTGFHWRDGWFFKRMADGSVRMSHVTGSPYIHAQCTIPAAEWASIVCSVSKLGEDAARWDAAQDFHGRPSQGEEVR